MTEPYPDNDAHLQDELRHLDLLLALRVAAFRREMAGWAPDGPDGHGHGEIDRLLAAPAAASGLDADLHETARVFGALVRARAWRSAEEGIPLALPRLSRLFGLDGPAQQLLVICLAPDLDDKYERIYAYLQDDPARRRPAGALAGQLLAPGTPWAAARWLLDRSGPLRAAGLVHAVPDPAGQDRSVLARGLCVDERVLAELLGLGAVDRRLDGLARREPPPAAGAADPAIVASLGRLLGRAGSAWDPGLGPVLIHLHGPRGAGRREAAGTVCAGHGRPLLVADLPRLLGTPAELERLLDIACREAVLSGAVLYLDEADPLFADDAAAHRRALSRVLGGHREPVFLAGTQRQTWPDELRDVRFHPVTVGLPSTADREIIWKDSLQAAGLGDVPEAGGGDLAARYRLTPFRIRGAVASAALEALGREGRPQPVAADLTTAARQHTRGRLSELASHVDPRAGWPDLVLDPEQKAQLAEVCAQIRLGEKVLEHWGLAGAGRGGRAVTALFTGPPGTGKTLAAEVMARDLGLDLYVVDLSAVVSKYIGETEKNLAAVFGEAEAGSCVLFFDEADALFGKRTAISDAHDRYANVETSYLLRRIEESDAVVVLATNLRENIDEAFTRRLRAVIEFPFPDEARRREIWARHLPGGAPVGADVDLDVLARAMPVAGGSIRTIVINAVFLAASDAEPLQMHHLAAAARREFRKLGRRWGGLAEAGPAAKEAAHG